MSAKVRSTEAIAAKTAIESKSSSSSSQIEIEIECAKCDCCALIEECTPGYIAKIRERYNGRWICGLCSEAVKDEMCRSKRLISTEEALNRHMSFSTSFRSSPPPMNSSEELISAMKQLLRKSLDSPRAVRSTPGSPRAKDDGDRRRALARAGSCYSKIAS